MRRLFASALVLSLAACGAGGVIADYGSIRPVTLVHGDVDWKFYDRPQEGRVMVAPTVASVRQVNSLDAWSDPARFQAAAQAWLAPRGCTATGVKPLIKAQMEVTYTC